MGSRGMGRLVLAALAVSAAQMPKLVWGWLASFAASCAVAGATEAPSRAAAWLLHDGVQPIADLVNTAEPGKPPAFRERVGSFKVETEDRALRVTGSFPKANVWRFDLTTADGQFDMRRLYVEHGAVACPDPDSIQTRRIGKLLGDPAKGLSHTGPWQIFNGE